MDPMNPMRAPWVFFKALSKGEVNDNMINYPESVGCSPGSMLMDICDHYGQMHKCPMASELDPNLARWARILIKQGANPNQRDQRGNTNLHKAANSPDVGIMNALLEGGADRDATTHDGSTAVHVAAKHRRSDVIECLMRWGASPATLDNAGNTALWYAIQGPNTQPDKEEQRQTVSSIALLVRAHEADDPMFTLPFPLLALEKATVMGNMTVLKYIMRKYPFPDEQISAFVNRLTQINTPETVNEAQWVARWGPGWFTNFKKVENAATWDYLRGHLVRLQVLHRRTGTSNSDMNTPPNPASGAAMVDVTTNVLTDVIPYLTSRHLNNCTFASVIGYLPRFDKNTDLERRYISVLYPTSPSTVL
jgi:hypothetical protein